MKNLMIVNTDKYERYIIFESKKQGKTQCMQVEQQG